MTVVTDIHLGILSRSNQFTGGSRITEKMNEAVIVTITVFAYMQIKVKKTAIPSRKKVFWSVFEPEIGFFTGSDTVYSALQPELEDLIIMADLVIII